MANDMPVALVTAAAGAGIGAEVARRLSSDGFDVVVTDAHERRCREFAQALSAELGRDVLSYHLDVTDHAQVRAVIDDVVTRRARLDVLVNNAGWSKIEPVAQMSLETWQRCLDVDLTGTFVMHAVRAPHHDRRRRRLDHQHLLDRGVGDVGRPRRGLLGRQSRRPGSHPGGGGRERGPWSAGQCRSSRPHPQRIPPTGSTPTSSSTATCPTKRSWAA